jgi:uncharacterized protein YjdB
MGGLAMRKLYILAMAAIAASGALTGCVQETGSDSLDPTLVCFHASIEDNGTKTSYAGSGKVDWSESDVIRYYMSKNGTVSEYTVPQSGHKTDINVAVVPGSSFFVAAYGGEGISSNTSTSFTLTGAVKAEQNGSFANAHVAACRTEDVSGATALSFYNLTSLVSFSISRTDISYVTFTAIGGEPLHGNGTLKIDFSQNNTPSASFGSSTGNSIRIDLEGPGVYYISTLPTTLSQGFRLEYYSSSNVLLGHTDATKSQTLARNGLLKLGPLERHIESETPTGGSDSGVYLGIIGFNQMLYRYPIGILNEDSKPGFTTFVEELPSKDGTLLYYSVDEAINSLLSAEFPSDLFNVSLVTFTDGLDQGSMMMTSLYESDEEYLEAIGKRIAEEKVSSFPISAYSIGLRGSDVTDVNKFRSNLKALASTDANAYEVTSMSAVNSKFQDIAENVNSSTYTYSISLKIPGPSNGTKVRFTLDNVSSATNSQKYIEGVFNLKSKTLTDVVYYGLTSTTGSTVQGTVEGIFVTFSFEGLQTSDNSFIQQGNIKQWNYVTSTSSWQVNSEFSPAQNSTIGHSKRSAVVMLLLDCSSSLGSKFSTMQQGADSFISILAEAAEDKYSVASVTLDKTELTLLLGGSGTLTATILPATALEKGLTWTSSDERVVTVDQNGKVTAVGLGKASITVTTVDGAKTASCEATVNQLVESITLDKTEIEIYVGDDPTPLIATILPESATDKSLTWQSSKTSVATVDSEGKVTAVSKGSATVTVKANDGSNVSAECLVTVVLKLTKPDSVAAVDLGLPSGLKWASCNVGAINPEGYGEYFAWGETEPKDYYDGSSYKWCNGNTFHLTKYCPASTKNYWAGSGSPDNKTFLDLDDDAASANWGGSWRMPTSQEWTELERNCIWTWTSDYNGTGVKGMIVTAGNGNSIFLPAAGYMQNGNRSGSGSRGEYWSADSSSSSYPEFGYGAYLKDDGNFGFCTSVRDKGLSVRPVFGDRVESITLSQTELEMYLGDDPVSIIATLLPDNTTKHLKWTSSLPSVATVDADGKVTAVSFGSTKITVKAINGSSAGTTCTVTVKLNPIKPDFVEAVDLGLPSGLKWASCNVGALKIEDYGAYFAWGEKEPKTDYNWTTYKYGFAGADQDNIKLIKYCSSNGASYWAEYGSPDNRTVLYLSDDAARANWGGGWRMPTEAEWTELVYNCSWGWTDNYNETGIKGRIATGSNGNSIFLPAAGGRNGTGPYDVGLICYYWSSTLTSPPYFAWKAYFDSDYVYLTLNGGYRCDGLPVRPVTE